ncbi:MAG TPA: NADP oxidoreductase [Thiotrichaceae bacterium]|jgi:ferredoxin--NADP+ reductase|nr:NADP oxidoreductase [Thiotrichaceae bacterium]
MATLGTEENPLLVAIVGSGPSGFYAAEALIKSDVSTKIDMLERLPSPYGLVRSGVAPDHPKLKQVINLYQKTAGSPDFNLIANVNVGTDISIEELCQSHHAVIMTSGAETDRKLGVPGEDLQGSYTATEFVGWYNGHPDYRNREFDLSHDVAVIIGQGNVAADVSRILSKTVDELKHTDIAQHALDALAESKIKEIHVIGRRGPAQAKFTPKELREFGELSDCNSIVREEDMLLNPESEAELLEKSNIASKKIYDQFCEFSKREADATKSKNCYFDFLMGPKELIGDTKLEKVILEKNKLSGDAFKQSARGTGEIVELETGILFRSIGYRGVPVTGVPFHDAWGTIPNEKGRVTDNDGNIVPKLYTSGWIKRGPSGIIGTNRACSVETVQCLLGDLEKLDDGVSKSGAETIYSILDYKNIRHISFDDWKKIDTKEIEVGEPKGKPREKFTYVDEMLSVIE